MKKIYIILFTVFLTIGFQSCTPQSLDEEVSAPQACCDEEGTIPPPPPPPGGSGG